MFGRTLEQRVQHVKGQLAALAFDLRQARADEALSDVARLEKEADELLEALRQLVPPQRAES